MTATNQSIVGHKGEVLCDSMKPDGTPRKLMDSFNLHSLGWEPEICLGDGIKAAYRWFLENHH